MVFGPIPFYCTECNSYFMALGAEWNATALIAPAKCPKCGTFHTLPWSKYNPSRFLYKRIWKMGDDKP